MKFGDYLKEKRGARGWTQPEAASAIEIEQSFLSKLENGKAYPSEETFDRLVSVYDIPIETLVASLFPGEVDRLREIKQVRALLLQSSQSTVQAKRRWLGAGVGALMLGGGFLGLAGVERGSTAVEHIYQSTGVIGPAESFDLYNQIGRPLPEDEELRRQQQEILARVDDVTRSTKEYRGPSFIEETEGGRRNWRLVGGVEGVITQPFTWARVPGWALILGGLGCFFVSWRWPSALEGGEPIQGG